MAIQRTNSSFIIGFEELKQRIELANDAESVRSDMSKGIDKASKGKKDKKSNDAVKATEAFRTMTEHYISLDNLCSKLETNAESGLREDVAKSKLNVLGPNRLTERKPTPWYCLLLKTLTSFFSLLLWAGSLLSFIAYGLTPLDPSNLYLGIVLGVTVLVTAIFSFYQESKSLAIMAGFKNMIPPETTVIRDGREMTLESALLVPGDLVKIKAGARIPADIRIIEANNGLKVDNSSLTGESEPLARTIECTNEKEPLETKNMAFFGTTCADGTGVGIVINTGDRTVIGAIAKLTNTAETEETTLAREVTRFIKIICAIAISLGVIFLILGIIIGYDAVTNMVNTIGIIVANVPEGLLCTLTVSLSITAKKMAEKNVLVKNLESVETLGSTSCICSDKTGTLTENKMTIVALWYDLEMREVTNYEKKDVENHGFKVKDPTFKMMQVCATLNNKAKWNFEPPKNMIEDENGNLLSENELLRIRKEFKENFMKESIKTWPVMGGDASETAMIRFFHSVRDIDEMRNAYPVLLRNGIKGEIPFNSANKYAVTIHEPLDFAPDDHRNDCVLFMKGAPEQIWDRCSNIMINGEVFSKTEDIRKSFNEANKKYGGMGRRVLGYAMIWLPSSEYGPDHIFDPTLREGPNFPLTGLTFLGLSALEDPPKQKVKEAVECCYQAGIKVVMVTGDQPLTATAIARQISIIIEQKTCNEIAEETGRHFIDVLDESDAVVVHGGELSKFVEEDKDLPFLDQRLSLCLSKRQVVFARTSPAQKYLIVDCAQKLGHIVAVTGDGVNDSPAIKKADIGIAMAIVGSDVAKDAADMLLMDDNFASIVEGVEQGRKVFDNLKKSIAYTIAVNIPELLPFLALITFQIPLPLSTVLMLVICLGTDMIPAISQAYEEPELDIMNRKPRNSAEDHLVSAKLIISSYMIIGPMQTIAGFLAYFVILYDYGFPPGNLWYLALDTNGTEPNKHDVYNPDSKYKGNTNVGTSKDGVQVDYTSTAHADYDLRIWYWRLSGWNTCRFQDDVSPVTDTQVCYSTEAVKYAQFGYFLAVVVVQWVNLLVVKTRTLSIIQHGLRNKVSWFGLFSESVVCLLLGFVPKFGTALGGRPLQFIHWFFPGFPVFILILLYEEIRKLIIRRQRKSSSRLGLDRKGWVEENTVY